MKIDLLDFMEWQNKNAEKLIKFHNKKIGEMYIKHKKLSKPEFNICLDTEEKDLLLDSLETAIAVVDWDNYVKEFYANPDAQISKIYELINKIRT